jgi:diguanylate cyclase (GGDEF)-like protein
MNSRQQQPCDAMDEVSALIATLHTTERRLEELTAGEVDAVSDDKGRAILLRRAQDQLRHDEATKQAAILNALPACIALLDVQGRIISVNEAWRQFGGAKGDQNSGYGLGLNYLDICDNALGNGSSEAHQIAEGVRSVLDRRVESFSIEYPSRFSTEEGWILLTVTPLGNSPTNGAVIMHVNNTEQRQAKDALRELAVQMIHLAKHDVLTGLPNRTLLNDRITQAIVLARRHARPMAVLFLDLDGFKHINDSLGHQTGDKFLQSIAGRLVACVRASDTVSRQGGDEFIVLLSELEHAESAAICANKILQAVAAPHSIEQNDLHITTSIGISIFPGDGGDAETLIKNADTAMYQAKENGRRGYRFFKPAMNVRAVERQSIEESLRLALERGEFTLHYQPKINLTTGAITGAEALIRWTHPIRGLVSPADFIPVAEDCGLIVQIGNWVLRTACEQVRAWLDAGLLVPTVAVNVSAMEFRNETFLEGVIAVLKGTGLEPRALELEITESVLIERVDATASILQTLRERGVQVAIDDFGTGYSSLSYLRKFPVDTLKIDQSFVRQISTVGDDTTIVAAIISMARSLKLRVVAEGVENQEQLAFLQRHHCDEAQGYFFNRPMPPGDFASLLNNEASNKGCFGPGPRVEMRGHYSSAK